MMGPVQKNQSTSHSKLGRDALAVRVHTLEASRNRGGAILVRSTLH